MATTADLYVVLSGKPICNTSAYLVYSRCQTLGVPYYSEYEDAKKDAKKDAQFIAVGPATKGDADAIKGMITSAGGEAIVLKGE